MGGAGEEGSKVRTHSRLIYAITDFFKDSIQQWLDPTDLTCSIGPLSIQGLFIQAVGWRFLIHVWTDISHVFVPMVQL